MFSKKRTIKVIDIIFWTIIIINVVIELVKGVKEGNIQFDEMTVNNVIGVREYASFIAFSLFSILFLTVISLLKMFYLTIIYIGLKVAYKKHSSEKLDKFDFKNDTYYRDIISKYSPGVLSYIDDFDLDEKDIVATIMSLELKNKIKINDKIEIVNTNQENLEENEKYILNKIIENKTEDINLIEFEKQVVNDCISNNLLEYKKDVRKKIIKKIVICILIYILVIVGFQIFPSIFNKISTGNEFVIILLLTLVVVLFFAMVIFPFTTITYLRTYYFMNKLDPYVRNENSKEINIKIEGLKKYIKEYSMLDNKEHEYAAIWDNYLIYAVIFGMNTKIVSEIKEKL